MPGVRSSRFLDGRRLLDDAENVAFLHDQQVLSVDLHFGAGPLAEQHGVTHLEVDRNELAGLVARARADSDDFALLRLLLGGVGNDDAAGGLLFGIDAAHDDTVVERAELHASPPSQISDVHKARAGPSGGAKSNWERKNPSSRGQQKNFSSRRRREPATGQ